MTLAEFKAWFEGFTESIEGKAAPTQKQWAKIKEKVAAIDGTPITYPIYIDRYVHPSWPHPYQPIWVGASGGIGMGSGSLTVGQNMPDQMADLNLGSFDSLTAMHALGCIEAKAN